MNDFTISFHKKSFEFFNIESLINFVEQYEYITSEQLFENMTRLVLLTQNGMQIYEQFFEVQIESNVYFPNDLKNIVHSLTFTIDVMEGEVSFSLYFTEEYTYGGYDLHEVPYGTHLESFNFEFKILDETEIKHPVNQQLVIE